MFVSHKFLHVSYGMRGLCMTDVRTFDIKHLLSEMKSQPMHVDFKIYYQTHCDVAQTMISQLPGFHAQKETLKLITKLKAGQTTLIVQRENNKTTCVVASRHDEKWQILVANGLFFSWILGFLFLFYNCV